MGGVKNMEPDSSQWCPGQKILFKHNKKLLCFESDQYEQVVQRSSGVFILEVTQNWTRHSPDQPALIDAAQSQSGTAQAPEGPPVSAPFGDAGGKVSL